MKKTTFKVTDDKVVRYSPVVKQQYEGMFRDDVVIDRETFIECLNRWFKPKEGAVNQYDIKCHKILSWDEVMDLMDKAIDEMTWHGVQANKIRVAKRYELSATEGKGVKAGWICRYLGIPLEFCELPERVNFIVESEYANRY